MLKEQLIQQMAASEQRRLQQLCNAEELGDQKPSQLLHCMQQLLGDKALDSSFIKELFQFLYSLSDDESLSSTATSRAVTQG